jgi:hypothetical protein
MHGLLRVVDGGDNIGRRKMPAKNGNKSPFRQRSWSIEEPNFVVLRVRFCRASSDMSRKASILVSIDLKFPFWGLLTHMTGVGPCVRRKIRSRSLRRYSSGVSPPPSLPRSAQALASASITSPTARPFFDLTAQGCQSPCSQSVHRRHGLAT